MSNQYEVLGKAPDAEYLKKLSPENVHLTIKGLSAGYGKMEILHNLDLFVSKAQSLCLIGPNGAGKTTTFNMIAGSEKPTDGKIFLYDLDVTGYPTHKLYELGLIRTFQLSHEYKKMTVLENLMVAGSNQLGENMFNTWFSRKKVEEGEKLSLIHI